MTARLLLLHPDSKRPTFVVAGRHVFAADAQDVRLPDQPDTCPDCTGPLDFVPTGNPPAAVWLCADCGSLFAHAHTPAQARA